MKNLVFSILTPLLLIISTSCNDKKESNVSDFIAQRINSQSQGTIKLSDFKKTNGYEQEMMGMKMYVLEWAADILVQNEIWKVGNNLEGYWQSFNVTLKKPDYWNAYANANMPKHFGTGASIHLTGDSRLHKTEKGWIVEELNLKTYQILNEGDLPENRFIGNWAGENASYCKLIKTDQGIKYLSTNENFQELSENYFMSYNNGILSGGYTELFSKASDELIKCNFSFKLIDNSTMISQSSCGVLDGIKYHKK
jgi:hypothetical protein